MERFLRTKLLLGEDALEKLHNAKVTILGLGAVGSFVGEALIRSGVKNLRLIDFDKITLTNLNRCLLALESNVGEYKVDVAKKRYLQINSDANIEALHFFCAKESIESIIDNVPSIVVDAIDSVNPKVDVLEELSKRGIPIISSMGAALKIDPLKVNLGNIFETKNCTLAKWVRKNLRKRGVIENIPCVYSEELPRDDALLEDISFNERELNRGRERHTMGSIITVTGVFGLTIASYVINFLINKDNFK